MAQDDPVAAVDALLADLGEALRHAHPPLAEPLPTVLGPPRTPAPSGLPVLQWLDALAAQAPPPARRFAAALAAIAPRLQWRQTYGPEAGEPFLANYGWTELIGPQGARDDQTVSIGLLVLGPGILYPPHQHPATERYVPLSGLAEWFDEDHGWREVAPLTTILHRANVRHAMRTGDQPLLAFFHWSGDEIGVHARLS